MPEDTKKFIIRFLEAVFDFSKEVVRAFDGDSLYYKSLKRDGYNPRTFYKNLSNLKTRGILEQSGEKFTFTPKGKYWARRSVHRYFKLSNRKWDKKWRIVIFDIPEELHNNRIRFRKKLQSLGFYMLQKSVFVFPYPCEEELGHVASNLEISDYIDVIIAENIGFREKDIQKFYNL